MRRLWLTRRDQGTTLVREDYFTDVPPYDKAPSLGQSLRLDVVSVTAK